MKKSYFTLIELLIVISIIAMLAAMLLPALTKARNRASQIYCNGNLKQIFTATLGYTSDYSSYIPFGYDASGSYSGYVSARTPAWFYQLAPYLNLEQRDGLYESLGKTYAERPKGPIIYTCPAHKIPFPNSFPTSYAPEIRVALGAPAIDGLQKGRMEKVKNPSSKAWVNEWAYWDGTNPAYPSTTMNGGSIIPGNTNNCFGTRHMGSGNILFFDGHSTWVPFKDVMSPSAGQIVYGGIFDTYR